MEKYTKRNLSISYWLSEDQEVKKISILIGKTHEEIHGIVFLIVPSFYVMWIDHDTVMCPVSNYVVKIM